MYIILLLACIFPQRNSAPAYAKVELEAMFVTYPGGFARKAGIEPTLTVLETALLPLEDFRKNRVAPIFPGGLASASSESKLSLA